jgi:hypothetical protein
VDFKSCEKRGFCNVDARESRCDRRSERWFSRVSLVVSDV